MTFLPPDDRDRLLALLQQLPNIDDPATRRQLLDGLPETLQQAVPYSDIASDHLAAIVDTLANERARAPRPRRAHQCGECV